MVFLVFCFVTLWTSIGPSIHKQYEVPVPVRYSHFFSLSHSTLTTDIIR
jgi:hypothetical protein